MPKPVDVTLPSDCEIAVARSFEAPRQLIWDCHTKPELMQRWCLGSPGWSMPLCEIDLRVGGKYRYVWRNDADGREFGSHGVQLEIDAPARLVNTESMDGFDGEAINTLELVEQAGRTTLTVTMRFPTQQHRDGALQSGMADGMALGYDRIEVILAESTTA